MQAVGKKLGSDLADLKSRLKAKEMETRKANAKFVSSIAAQEKLKTEFDAERKAWAEEKNCTGDPGRTGGEGPH